MDNTPNPVSAFTPKPQSPALHVGPPSPVTFLAMAQRAKRMAPWWAILPIGIMLLLVGAILGAIPLGVFEGLTGGSILMGDESDLSSVGLGLLLIATTLGPMIALILWMRFYQDRDLASMGLGFRGAVFKFLRGAMLGALALCALFFILKLSGLLTVTSVAVPESWTKIWPLGILLLGWAIQGSSEEVLTRGYLFQTYGAKYGLIVGALISSVAFTLMHGFNENPSLIFFVDLMVYSLLCCVYAVRENSLWGVCGFHAAWNFTQGNIFDFAVSGSRLSTDQMVRFSLDGPVWLTGGETGIEGSILSTLLMIVLGGLIWVMIKPKSEDDSPV